MRSVRNPRLLIYLAAWFANFFLLAFSVGEDFPLEPLLLISFFVIWFKLARSVYDQIQPPIELLLVGFLVFGFLDNLVLRAALTGLANGLTFNQPSSGLALLHVVFLASTVLLYSQVLVQNGDGRRSMIVWISLIGLLASELLAGDNRLGFAAIAVLLFVSLLRNTTWLEQLTKGECWVYWVVFLFLYRVSGQVAPFDELRAAEPHHADLWRHVPHFLYLAVRIYLLALIIKVPIVLVYNFASLSRKLRISGLFQSTFPLIIQMFVLTAIFFLLVSGLQAERIRMAILAAVDSSSSLESSRPFVQLSVPLTGDVVFVDFSGYENLQVAPKAVTRNAVAQIRKSGQQGEPPSSSDYFLLSRREKQNGPDVLQAIRLDSVFLAHVAEKLSILAGTHLLAYPYEPHNWENMLYELDLGPLSFWGKMGDFSIFSLGFLRSHPRDGLAISLEQAKSGFSNWAHMFTTEDASDRIALGRLMAPVLGASSSSPGSYALEVVLTPHASFLTSGFLRYLVLLSVVFALVNILITKRMVRFGSEINSTIVQRFNQLRRGIREISTGNLAYKVQVHGRDEFVELAERFNQMGEKLELSMIEVRDKERLDQELKIARQVQLDLLRGELPEIPGFQVAAGLETANEVGGDFYDVIRLSDTRFLFAIGDVSGKGTSAAFYMAQCISLLRYSPEFTQEPDEIALRLNAYFAAPTVDRHLFVTAIVGVLDTATQTAHLVRAGHPKPILMRAAESEELSELQCEGLGIGLQGNGEIFRNALTTVKFRFRRGDTLVFFTDGVEEAARPITDSSGQESVEFFSLERLRKQLESHRGLPAEEIRQKTMGDVREFYSESPAVDDYTVLVLKRE